MEKTKYKYRINYVTYKKELLSFDVIVENWEGLKAEVDKNLPEDAEYVCSIQYDNWYNTFQHININ